jgi:hypothetical protein
MLFEGEHQGDITIEQINEKEGTVQLKQGETPLTVSFKENGVKGGPPVAGGSPGSMSPQPNFQPNPFGGGSTPGQKMIPSRPLRPSGGPGGNAGYDLNNGNGNSAGNASLGNPGGTSFGAGSPQSVLQQQQPQMSAEESEIMIAAQHQAALAKGDGSAALLPPTVLNPTRNVVPDEGSVNPNVNPNPAPTPTTNPRFPGRRGF